MQRTLQHGETVQTLAEWGFSGCVLTDRGWAPSTFQFNHDGAAFDAAPIFERDDAIKVYLDGVVKFVGFITQTPSHVSGDAESFINGVQSGTTAIDTTNYSSTNVLTVGILNGRSRQEINAWTDETRITKGVARYTADFTPDAAQFPDS